MKYVYAVIGIRSQVDYEDPGAEETFSVWSTRKGAEAEAARLHMQSHDVHTERCDSSGWPSDRFEVRKMFVHGGTR